MSNKKATFRTCPSFLFSLICDLWTELLQSIFHTNTCIIPAGCDVLIVFTSAQPRLHSYTNMINTPAGWWQNGLTVFVSVRLPDVKSINYLSAKKEKTSDPAHRVEECYSFWPLKFSAWLNHISSEWYSELFLMISKCNHLKMQHGVT